VVDREQTRVTGWDDVATQEGSPAQQDQRNAVSAVMPSPDLGNEGQAALASQTPPTSAPSNPPLKKWLADVGAKAGNNGGLDPKSREYLFVEAFEFLKGHVLARAGSQAAAQLENLYPQVTDVDTSRRDVALSLFDHATERVRDGRAATITVTLSFSTNNVRLVNGEFQDPTARWVVTSILGPKEVCELFLPTRDRQGQLIQPERPVLSSSFAGPESALVADYMRSQVGSANAETLSKLVKQLSVESGSDKQGQYRRLVSAFEILLQLHLDIDEQTILARPASSGPQQLNKWRNSANRSEPLTALYCDALAWLENYCRLKLDIPDQESVFLGSAVSAIPGADENADGLTYGLPFKIRFTELYAEFPQPSQWFKTIRLHADPSGVGDPAAQPVLSITLDCSGSQGPWQVVLLTTCGGTETFQHKALAFNGLTDKDPADYTLSTNYHGQ
jgi:hypothetical protein